MIRFKITEESKTSESKICGHCAKTEYYTYHKKSVTAETLVDMTQVGGHYGPCDNCSTERALMRVCDWNKVLKENSSVLQEVYAY